MFKNFLRYITLLLFPIVAMSTPAIAQISKPYKSSIELQAIGTSKRTVPFWMRSNQYGSIPLSGISTSILGTFGKDYDDEKTVSAFEDKPLLDWGLGIEGRANIGQKSNLQLIQAYAKVKLSIFQAKIGRSKDVMGLNGDTVLSSGNFAESGNALGIPKIELSIPNYWRLPFFDGLFAIKGNFSHGWVGKVRILDSITSLPPHKEVYYINEKYPSTYLHQKSLYIKLGLDSWRLQLYGGFSHQVFWGNEKNAYGSNFRLSGIETFTYVATGKSYGSEGVPRSKIGNQLGSIDLGVEYKFDTFNLFVYRQNLYDVGALSKLANIADGLNGVSIANNLYSSEIEGFQWKKILLELFYTKDQAGYPWSIPTKSGDEDYYNNFYYLNGWSYRSLGLGNPLITRRQDARAGQAFREDDYFINNRVAAVNLGFSAGFNSWSYVVKGTYSMNYGTFGTSKYGNSTGSIRDPRTGDFFKKVPQLSIYLDVTRNLTNGYILGFSGAYDNGKLLDNSIGALLKVKREF